jgi:alpha-beta hydrolase superfamily lysophospholipase
MPIRSPAGGRSSSWSPTATRQGGVKDVTVSLYPGARHEVFNETNRDEITADLVTWLDRITVP